MHSMSDPDDGNSRSDARDLMRGASPQMAKTVGLLLVAFILGVVMLNIFDDAGDKNTKVVTGNSTTTTTDKNSDPGASTTTQGSTATTGAVLAPAQIRLIVLNGSGVNGVAKTTANALKAKGYSAQEEPNTAPATRKGSAVQCRSGLSREAAALVQQLTNKSNKVVSEDFPATLPKLAKGTIPASVQCIVIIGATS